MTNLNLDITVQGVKRNLVDDGSVHNTWQLATMKTLIYAGMKKNYLKGDEDTGRKPRPKPK